MATPRATAGDPAALVDELGPDLIDAKIERAHDLLESALVQIRARDADGAKQAIREAQALLREVDAEEPGLAALVAAAKGRA